MLRQIITIDEEKCNGCGLCAEACHEAAIGMVNGKAKLLRDDYCDGMGNCLPACPTGAIVFTRREAAAFDEKAVKAKTAAQACSQPAAGTAAERTAPDTGDGKSELRQWPVQIKLVREQAPCFENAELLVSADCAAYAYGNFHRDFLQGKTLLVGCPKLDNIDYSEKLAGIIAGNNITSITVVRMEVPCCGGIENAVKVALKNSGKALPLRVTTISIEGEILGG
jgi:ferredoxin/phosphohistidine swiveling domain-containing protein